MREERERGVRRHMSVTQQSAIIGVACGASEADGQPAASYLACMLKFTFANDQTARFKHVGEFSRHFIKSFGAR